MTDWKIFKGDGGPHLNLASLPAPPPWRFAREQLPLSAPTFTHEAMATERRRAQAFIVSEPMRLAVNAALYLRRPLLLTGNPGTGKSTLISKVAAELQLGPVLRWPINSRSTVRSGVYEYDAIGRLQSGRTDPPVEDYLTLGPLGTALMAQAWPRALLIDEIDKSDLDFANDLLNVIDEGVYDIPELVRLHEEVCEVRNADNGRVAVTRGHLACRQFPIVIMTSNAEREFPAAFLRRCVRLTMADPTTAQLAEIVSSQLHANAASMDLAEVEALIARFAASRRQNAEVATDQLLNAVYLTVAMRGASGRTFGTDELEAVRQALLQPLA
jgi:MoxR-like ATPase